MPIFIDPYCGFKIFFEYCHFATPSTMHLSVPNPPRQNGSFLHTRLPYTASFQGASTTLLSLIEVRPGS